MTKPFKHYVWIPHDVPNAAKYRADADNEYLFDRGLTIEDVTVEDQGEIEPHTYLSIFTPKPFVCIRRFFHALGRRLDRWL